MKTLFRLFLSACVSFSSLIAGPFGLEKGQTAESFGRKLKPTTGSVTFDLSSPPKPHPRFPDYRLWISPTSGLAGVGALSDVIQCNSFGNQLRDVFAELENALTEKYGTPKKFDFLQSGSIWNEPNDWMMGLAKEERHLLCVWEAKPDSPLPDGLRNIELKAVAPSRDKGLIKVFYRFTNFDDIKKDREKKEASAL